MYALPNTPLTLTANIGDPSLTTVGMTLVNATDGSVVTPRTQTGIVETPAESGIYSTTITSPVTLGSYIAVFDVASAAPFVAVDFAVVTEVPYLADLPEGLLTRIKERTESDLSDDELVRIASEARVEIVRLYGADATGDPITERVRSGAASFQTSQRIDSSQPVTITADSSVVDASTYHIIHGGRLVKRIGSALPRWYGDVQITYTPQSDNQQRDEATIKLVSLALEYRGGTRYDSAGDASQGYAIYTDERNAILRELAPHRSFMVA